MLLSLFIILLGRLLPSSVLRLGITFLYNFLAANSKSRVCSEPPLSLRFVVPRLGMRQREAAQKLCLYILELCVRNVYICTSHINIFKSVCLFPEAFAYQNVAHQKGKRNKIFTYMYAEPKKRKNKRNACRDRLNIDTIWSERQPKIDYSIYFPTRISCAAQELVINFIVMAACVKNGPPLCCID